MERVMPEGAVAPYLGSLEIYRRWMRLRLEGLDDNGAWGRIISAMPRGERRRALARTTVAGANGQGPLTLSVPVQGGGSTLKRGYPGEWRLSMHGRWQAVHLGALATAWSATPFFPHVMPLIHDVLDSTYEGMPFGEMTATLHRVVAGVLDVESLLPEIRSLTGTRAELIRRLSDEKMSGFHTDFTILDVIFRKGPEGIFLLL
ncbi:MAG: WbqC family protein [Bacteroides sp.]|nr:WbqC family protein [Bacteroides sp.]